MKSAARAAVLLLLAVAWSGSALGETPRQAAQAAFARGEQAARELRFKEALAAYEEAVSRDPTAPAAPVARARAEDLRAHAEGEFAPLARLEAVRRDPLKNRDPEVIAELEREARGFPDGRVRGEALLVVAQAYAHVLGSPERAVAALSAIGGDAFADRGTRALALSELVPLHLAKGDTGAALAAVSREPELLPNLTREVRAAVRRGQIAEACFALLGALALAALWGGVRAARRLGDVRALAPLVLPRQLLLFAFYLGAGGAVFVRLYGGEGDPLPFLGLGLGVTLASALVRLWSLAGVRPSRAHTVLRAAAGALGVLAMAYLILWKSSPDYLAPLGF